MNENKGFELIACRSNYTQIYLAWCTIARNKEHKGISRDHVGFNTEFDGGAGLDPKETLVIHYFGKLNTKKGTVRWIRITSVNLSQTAKVFEIEMFKRDHKFTEMFEHLEKVQKRFPDVEDQSVLSNEQIRYANRTYLGVISRFGQGPDDYTKYPE